MSTTRKILILDDEESTLELLQFGFREFPYEAVFCSSGLDAAIAIFEAYKAEKPFDALILDCALPRLDGFTLAKIVRLVESIGLGRRSKIGYFTAHSKTVDQSTLLDEVGAEAYWRKPEDMENLPKLIALWLG
jgi:two-component system sensor histidine kinase EvgS